MTIAHQLEALLESAIAAGLCPELRGCDPATGEVLPAQYLLLTRARPHTRATPMAAAPLRSRRHRSA